ncbi:hypothetical protein BGX38DRAFT_1260974 [Terfezia claveryi]|nr:hypothetical protein BGX38DRAFT_1260974 [Terfezia claveryi]
MSQRPGESSQGVTRQQTIPSYDAEDEEDEDEETVLQPPHIALSSKRRAASDGTRPARKLLQFSPPAPPASRRWLYTYTESSEQQIDLTVNKPSRVGPRSRSFFAIPDEYKELTSRAAEHVCFYTLFRNPMLNVEEIQQLLSVAWLKAQEETKEKLKRMKTANAYAHQRHFRANEITEIIFHKYFSNMKMCGNSDDTFFDSINEVFICLVTSAMRHCLKAWTTGVHLECPLPEIEDETTSVGKLKNATMITRPTMKITLTDKWKNMMEVMR